MCGIAGLLLLNEAAGGLAAVATRMASAFVHRGPDSAGSWCDAFVGLAHRRLAIIDLTAAGHQPMVSGSGRYVISFNGEVYNFKDLRLELEGHGYAFIGGSDTEVVLAAIETWGIEAAVARCVGMFAFAVWDLQQRELTVVRDRLGEKPVYWTRYQGGFAFASELSGIRALGAAMQIDRQSAALFLRHNYVPGPRSIYGGVFKLQPGHIIRCRIGSGVELVVDEPRPFWSVDAVASLGRQNPFRGSFEDSVDALDGLLRRTVSQQMIADVPLGAFLSGGIDSSTVVALMQSVSSRPVQTYTIGFREREYDEAAHAEEVARNLGTSHTTLYVEPSDAIRAIPEMARVYDEPFADSSQVPTYLLASLTKRHVTVALSGDGGDELFCGYNRYIWGRDAWSLIRRYPAWSRRALHSIVNSTSPERWNSLLRPLMSVLPVPLRVQLPGDKLYKLADALRAGDPGAVYLRLLSHWHDPANVVLGVSEPATEMSARVNATTLDDFTRYMMRTDSRNYLPDDILVKVDRAAMAVSLEGRIPFLDHRIFEFASSLPLSYLLDGKVGKRVLRSVLYRYVPRGLVDRPKTGFGMPIDSWLRGPLREWASDLLSQETLKRQGLVNPQLVAGRWSEHLSGVRSWHYQLWDVLMLTSWMDEHHASA